MMINYMEDEDGKAAEMMEKLNIALKTLKPRERKIITEYYGINTDKKTQVDIGSTLKITDVRVRQIKIKALDKLGLLIEVKKINPY